MASDYEILVGFDVEQSCRMEIRMDLRSHPSGIVCGGSGSGKSLSLLTLMFEMLTLPVPVSIFVADPKASSDFRNTVCSENYAEGMTESAALIHHFYQVFQSLPEWNENSIMNICIIDELPGMLSALPDIIGGKAGKDEVEKLKSELSSILMLGRSRGVGLILVAQRASSAIFGGGTAQGGMDNMFWRLALGKLSTATHIALYPNEALENKVFAESYHPGTGSGYFLQDGDVLRAIRMPYVADKSLLLAAVRNAAKNRLS